MIKNAIFLFIAGVAVGTLVAIFVAPPDRSAANLISGVAFFFGCVYGGVFATAPPRQHHRRV